MQRPQCRLADRGKSVIDIARNVGVQCSAAAIDEHAEIAPGLSGFNNAEARLTSRNVEIGIEVRR